MKTKFKIIISALVLLWGIAFFQVIITKWYVSNSAFQQAFARNQIVLTKDESASLDKRNVVPGNRCKEGMIAGKLDKDRRQKVVENIFREFGAAKVMASDEENENYFVAYGYTSGIETVKYVNGKKININITLSYNEEKQKTHVIVGIPLINSDF